MSMEFKNLRTRDLKVDGYQRPVNDAAVANISSKFDQEGFGVLVVGKRRDGKKYVVDGRHRLGAAKAKKMTTVPCLVFNSSGREHESRIFRLLNQQRNMTRLDRLWARIHEGDEVALDIQKSLKKYGFSLSRANNTQPWPRIVSAASIEAAHKSGQLDNTLYIIKECWGHPDGGDDYAIRGPMISGLRRFMEKFEDVVDMDRLIERLREWTPAAMEQRSKALATGSASTSRSPMHLVIEGIYDHGRRKKLKGLLRDFRKKARRQRKQVLATA